MFREGIHRAKIRHRFIPDLEFECMLEYITDSRIYIYSNESMFEGTSSDAFKRNAYGFKYCFHSSRYYIFTVEYIDGCIAIGEL